MKKNYRGLQPKTQQEGEQEKKQWDEKTLNSRAEINVLESHTPKQQVAEKTLDTQTQIVLHQLSQLKQMITEHSLCTKDVLTMPEAAKYLSLSEGYLYQLISKGVIPHYKPNGKKLYFSRQELDNWVLSNKQQSRDEIRQSAEDFLVTGKRT
ncbi:helix-turn-helix domain-containing protein [Maribellus sediminis]|uniref:helix-turn-helix domain-containing protein n=1 Tax=Maribellus sediminis TaxID=2696285 RepID=UPI0014320412|nr:helix-turn-helix domain-containing protein [Maribellus sediminis]